MFDLCDRISYITYSHFLKTQHMKNLLFLLIALSGLSFSACETEEANEHEHDAVDLVALRAELQGMEDAYAKAQIAGDAEGVVKYYADDAVSLAPNKPAAKGKAAILALTKEQIAADTTGSKIQFEVVDVFAQGNLAVEVGKSTTTHKDGSKTTGKYISVFEKRDGKWLCIRDSYSEDAPAKM
jgi:uncharacterized protein (TIGR02246 family)